MMYHGKIASSLSLRLTVKLAVNLVEMLASRPKRNGNMLAGQVAKGAMQERVN
jgi:hypothetical protein